ncbi:unnamed protein product, partial [Sphagnum tenellum]
MADLSHLHCNFCGLSANEVKKLIAGPDIHICNQCVDKCYNILNEGASKTKSDSALPKLPSPREIKEFLDQYVIGQDHAKETLSVAVYNHYKRLDNPIIDGVEIDRGSILMTGPTGSGKTFLVQTIARILNVPFAIADATSLTQAGYVGDDVESIITRLLQASDNDVKKAERGIVFIDEIDKKSVRAPSGNSPDVAGEGVQQALLKMIEGFDVMVPPSGSKKNPNAEMIKVNTKNILFIVGGAFVGLEKIVERAITKENTTIGFGSKISTNKNNLTWSETLRNHLEPEHLVSYGLIPELVGRLPVVTSLDELDEEQLLRILTEPKNALIKQYQAMFKLDGIELVFDDDALLAIAKIARKRKTGGRALRSVIETKLMKTQFQLPDLHMAGVNRIEVGAATFNDNEPPVVFYDKP